MTANNVVYTPDHLAQVVERFMGTDAFVFDVETRPGPGVEVDYNDNKALKEANLNWRTNEVYWLSMATYGECVAIPIQHRRGEQVGWQPAPMKDGQKATKKKVPVWGPPPEQMMPSDVFPLLKPLFFDTTIRKIAHNAKFDLLTVAKYFGELPPGPYMDTVMMGQLLNENRPLDLGHLTTQEFKFTYDKLGGTLLDEPFGKSATYSYLDSKYTWLLYRKMLAALEAGGLTEYNLFESDVTEVLLNMEYRGAPIREDEVGDLDVLLRHEMDVLEAELYSAAGREFMLTAPADKGWFVYEVLGHEPIKFTPKKGEPSVAEEALKHYEFDPMVSKLMQWDDLHKLHSTYVLNYAKFVHQGRLHTNYKQAGARTGRFSCVSGATLLDTSRGTFRFDEYLPRQGDLVVTHTGRMMPVLRKVYKGIDQMYRVRLSNGSAIECTREHRVHTAEGWRTVGSLTVGDEVLSYVGVEEVCLSTEERQAGSDNLLRGRQANSGGDSAESWDDIPERRSHREHASPRQSEEGREGSSVLTIQDGTGEPYAGQEWFASPQPQRTDRGWARVSAGEGGGEVHLRTPQSDGDGAGSDGTPSGAGRPSHRRGQAQQHTGQPRASHSQWAPATACQEVQVGEITPLGPMGVWDIEVAGDHSYRSQGFLNHNSGSPNLQNVPKPDTDVGKKIRGLFWSGSDDECMVVGDYSQIELRVLAHFSGDPTMCAAFENGEDIHQASADRLGTDRSIAKNINFAIPFGAGPTKVAAMGGGKFSVATAKKFYAKHKEDFPRVWAFIDRTKENCRKTKPHEVYTILGRKRRLPDIGLPKHNEALKIRQAMAGRQAVNCFDAETEALTQRGWVRGFDLLSNDKFLTKNAETGTLEWRHAVHIWKYPDYTGPMIRVSNGRNLDVLTTPDHRWLVTDKKKKKNIVKTSEQLASLAAKQSDFAVHMQGAYSQTWSVYSDDFASLLGWILTDGYFGKTFVGIAQTKERQRKEIETLLDRMGLTYNSYFPGAGRSTQYKIHGQIAQRIKDICPQKTLTVEVLLGMGDTARQALFDSMMLGDGSDGERQTSFAAGSEVRADMFQFLCTLLGCSSTKAFRKYPVPAANGSEGCWVVAVNRRTTAQTAHCEKIDHYVGGTWCVTVPNSFAVFRRGGSSFVSGNSVIQGSAADLIKMGMIRIHDMLDDDMHLILQVHDELVVTTPRSKAERCAEIMREAMQGDEMQILRVPVTSNIVIVDRWSDAKA